MKGNQGAFQTWNQSYDDQEAFQPQNRICDN